MQTYKFKGYNKDESDNLVINKNQAKVVRRIYYLMAKSLIG
jgi:hypothetical protein